ADNERVAPGWGFPRRTSASTVFIITRMQQPIRILIIDPLAPSRERLVEALSHRFDAVAAERRLKALDVLPKSTGIRMVLGGTFSFGSLKQALTTDIVTPIDRLPRNPPWREVLRARVSPRNLWIVLNKDLVVRPVEAHAGMSVKEVLLMRVNAHNVARLVTRSYDAHASN